MPPPRLFQNPCRRKPAVPAPAHVEWFTKGLPGVIAIVLHEAGGLPNITKEIQAYPQLVRSVMPPWSLGFFAAALVRFLFHNYMIILKFIFRFHFHYFDWYGPFYVMTIDKTCALIVDLHELSFVVVNSK